MDQVSHTAENNIPADSDASVEPGVWRYAHASRASLVVDGENYFDVLQRAMLRASQRVLLIGWDFDSRIHLSKGRRWWQIGKRKTYPRRLGSFILWLTKRNPGLMVHIIKWRFGAFKFMWRGSMIFDLIRWWPDHQIHFRLDAAHPFGCSHHQKIIVLDGNFAMCGGIDMTLRRWDTRDHIENDDRRVSPDTRSYGPCHDMALAMEGDAAGALDELGRARWVEADGGHLKPCVQGEQTAWPENLAADFEDVEIGISRSRPAYGADTRIDEVEQLFLRQIAEARRFIYVENQYFASRVIAEAIAQRLQDDDPPEIVIVHAHAAQGWFEPIIMDPPRARLAKAVDALDKSNCFHLYVPYSGETPVYVHAKLMIVDDRVLRVGSSNFNNRSLGLDTECDVFIDADRPGNDHAQDGIRRLRHSLLAEHCGVTVEQVSSLLEEHGSMAAMIAATANTGQRSLRLFEAEDPDPFLEEMALREMFDPEHPDELFEVLPRSRGLFRPGSLLARALKQRDRKRSRP